MPSRPHSACPIIVVVDEEIELFLNDIARIPDLPLPRRPGHSMLDVHWAGPSNPLGQRQGLVVFRSSRY